jgi:hypothetical protein
VIGPIQDCNPESERKSRWRTSPNGPIELALHAAAIDGAQRRTAEFWIFEAATIRNSIDEEMPVVLTLVYL